MSLSRLLSPCVKLPSEERKSFSLGPVRGIWNNKECQFLSQRLCKAHTQLWTCLFLLWNVSSKQGLLHISLLSLEGNILTNSGPKMVDGWFPINVFSWDYFLSNCSVFPLVFNSQLRKRVLPCICHNMAFCKYMSSLAPPLKHLVSIYYRYDSLISCTLHLVKQTNRGSDEYKYMKCAHGGCCHGEKNNRKL